MLSVRRYGPPSFEEVDARDFRPRTEFQLHGARSRDGRPPQPLPVPSAWADKLPDPYGVVKAYAAFAEAICEEHEYAPGFLESLKLHRMFDALEKSFESKAWESADYTGIDGGIGNNEWT
jgi:predicted dehydrogenase